MIILILIIWFYAIKNDATYNQVYIYSHTYGASIYKSYLFINLHYLIAQLVYIKSLSQGLIFHDYDFFYYLLPLSII